MAYDPSEKRNENGEWTSGGRARKSFDLSRLSEILLAFLAAALVFIALIVISVASIILLAKGAPLWVVIIFVLTTCGMIKSGTKVKHALSK